MYRTYENPRTLEDLLEELMKRPEEDRDDYWYEEVAELKDRINFAWQDDEYDSDCYDPREDPELAFFYDR